MRTPQPENANAPCQGGAAKNDNAKSGNKLIRGKLEKLQRRSLDGVAIIQKSHSSQLQIRISAWRGDHKVEIREASSIIPGIFFPTSSGISLDVKKLPELIAAIVAVEREAIGRGLLHGRSAA